MKSYFDLTLRGKYARCKKAIDILSKNVNSNATLDRVYDCLYDCIDNGLTEENVKNLRKEIMSANQYRGYSNKCSLYSVDDLLV